MPVKFIRTRKSYFKRRRMTRRRPRKVMTVRKVKRIIDAELKFRDMAAGPVVMASSNDGFIIHLSNIGQGDEASERNGNWIKPTTLMGTITVQGNDAAPPTSTPLFRCVVVQWKENNSLNPIAISKVMQDAFAPHQQFNVQNKGQFKVLWSRTGILSNHPQNPQFQKKLRFYVKPPQKVLYDVAANRTGTLFLFAYSDVDVLDDPPTITFDARLRYTDS